MRSEKSDSPRRGRADVKTGPEGGGNYRAADVRLGETLRVKNGDIPCARCEEKICSFGSNPKKGPSSSGETGDRPVPG